MGGGPSYRSPEARRTGEPLPAYLAEYVTPVDASTVLTQAITEIDEASEICRKFSMQGVLFALRLRRAQV